VSGSMPTARENVARYVPASTFDDAASSPAVHAGHHVAHAAPAVEREVQHPQLRLGRPNEREADGGAEEAGVGRS